MDLALIALSARPLAASAARAGLSVLALDVRDTLDVTTGDKGRVDHVRLPSRPGAVPGEEPGFDEDALPEAIASHVPAGVPIIVGDGLDGMPRLLARIADRNPILGNAPTTVRVLKDPQALEALCGHLGIPCPAICLTAPAADILGNVPMLEKRIGGSGGGHVRRRAPDDSGGPATGYYLQREVAGETFSLLMLANGKDCVELGVSRHFPAGIDDNAAPFRLAGRIGPVDLPATLDAPIRMAARNIVRACGLVGLVSVRVIISGESWFVLGVTPHPDASLDLFDAAPLPPFMALHLAACGGRMPPALPAPAQVRAIASLRAGQALSMPALTSTATATLRDVPPPGTSIAAGDLVATVHVSATSPMQAEVTLMAALIPLQDQIRRAEG